MDLPIQPVPGHVGNGGHAGDGNVVSACSALAHGHNVGRNDGWHDAAYGIANDLAVHSRAATAWPQACANDDHIRFGISDNMGWIRPAGCAASSRAWEVGFTVVIGDLLKLQNCRSHVPTCCCLRILAAEAALPDAMQQSSWIYRIPLECRRWRCISNGTIAWDFLRRLLLGINAIVVHGRCDEPGLGCSTCGDRSRAEGFALPAHRNDDRRDRFGGGGSHSDDSLKPQIAIVAFEPHVATWS